MDGRDWKRRLQLSEQAQSPATRQFGAWVHTRTLRQSGSTSKRFPAPRARVHLAHRRHRGSCCAMQTTERTADQHIRLRPTSGERLVHAKAHIHSTPRKSARWSRPQFAPKTPRPTARVIKRASTFAAQAKPSVYQFRLAHAPAVAMLRATSSESDRTIFIVFLEALC